MSDSERKYALTREQIVAVFSGWTTRDIVLKRDGWVDAQEQTKRFLDAAENLFATSATPGIPTE